MEVLRIRPTTEQLCQQRNAAQIGYQTCIDAMNRRQGHHVAKISHYGEYEEENGMISHVIRKGGQTRCTLVYHTFVLDIKTSHVVNDLGVSFCAFLGWNSWSCAKSFARMYFSKLDKPIKTSLETSTRHNSSLLLINAHNIGTTVLSHTSFPSYVRTYLGVAEGTTFSSGLFFTIPSYSSLMNFVGIRNVSLKDVSQTKFLVSFVGSLENHPIRQQAYELFKNTSDVYISGNKKMGIGNFLSLKHQSKFCIVFRGTTVYSKSLADNVAANCIPVIFSDHWILPFSMTINWKDISVRFPENKMTEAIEYIRGLSTVHVQRLQMNLWKTRHLLLYHLDDALPSAYDMIEQELCELQRRYASAS
jgi:hypothetical protein